ncbi:MAG: ABC transporter ATP-binding protein [Hyphomicrobium sp.]
MEKNNLKNGIAIEVEGLTKSFNGKVVVDDLKLRVKRGNIYGFLGPNGSGKTTTLRMLCGLLTPDRGRGTCLGHDILKDRWLIKERVGYMTQHFSLYHDLTIKENLEFIARIYGLKNPKRAVLEAIDQLGLMERKDQLAGQLSGGWQQRLALSACILPKPELLLLDEPTAGVDPKARREFWNELHTLASEGLTVLVSTHYMDEAERCHEIAFIASGQLLTHGTVEDVLLNSGLQTWTVTTADPHSLALELQKTIGIDMVAPFGTSLHVSGRDARLLEQAIQSYQNREELIWKKSLPSLEDVFIDLMHQKGKNNNQKSLSL